MEQKIITSRHAHSLNEKIKEMQADGWECVGGHNVVTVISQNQYAGTQHMRTIHENEYSQTMKKND